MEADISRTEVEVSSALAESCSMLFRTVLIDVSICTTEADVTSVEVSCSRALRDRTRERLLIWWLTVVTSVASWAKRRMVRSRVVTSARTAADIRDDCVALRMAAASRSRLPAVMRFSSSMAESRRAKTRASQIWKRTMQTALVTSAAPIVHSQRRTLIPGIIRLSSAKTPTHVASKTYVWRIRPLLRSFIGPSAAMLPSRSGRE